VTVIAVAVAVIGAVILLTCGVVAGSEVPGTLSFFGVTVHTTSAQIFLTGAICTWTLLAAGWLLTAGIRRSRARGAHLASLRGQAHLPDTLGGYETTQQPAFTDPGPVAELLGFSTGGDRPRTDRSGPGDSTDRVDSGQHSAEQPPPRQ
jgi:hypothetical protein